MNTPHNPSAQPLLDDQQQCIVTISALTAIGDIAGLKQALNAGLDAGLTINEIKEVLVHLYAYCGFPRSLNGITAFMAVVDERTAAGKNDPVGNEASPIDNTADKYEVGQKTLKTLTGKPANGPRSGPNAFAPAIDTFLKEHLFADIFSRDVLTYTQRELATISTLASLSGVESQLQAHMGMGMNVGITEEQLHQLITLVESAVGKQQADTDRAILSKLMEVRQK
ncbi:carboxymuconolactone decarboxylase family protein [Spirosoma fluminis]